MKTVKNVMTYNHRVQKMVKTVGPSLTVPNEAMTPQDIVNRFQKGVPVSGAKEPIFVDQKSILAQWDLEKIHKMDLVDRQEIADYLRTFRAAAEQKLDQLDELAKQKKEADEQAAFDKRFAGASSNRSEETPEKGPKKKGGKTNELAE